MSSESKVTPLTKQLGPMEEAHWCRTASSFKGNVEKGEGAIFDLQEFEENVESVMLELKQEAKASLALIASVTQFVTYSPEAGLVFTVVAHVVSKDLVEAQQRAAIIAQGGSGPRRVS